MASNSGFSLSSQSSIEKVREELICSICFEQFREPKMLPCFHTFCKQCLEKTKRNFPGNLHCPTCRTKTEVSEVEMVERLPNNFIVNRVLEALTLENSENETVIFRCTNCEENNEAKWKCVDCRNFLCISCYEAHNRMSLFRKSHRVVGLDSQENDLPSLEFTSVGLKGNYCAQHRQKELDLYCNSCKLCVCTACFATKHQGHDLSNIEQAMEDQKAEIRKLLQTTDKKARGIQEGRDDVKALGESIDQKYELFMGRINGAAEAVRAAVNRKTQRMLSELANICKYRHKALDTHSEELGLEELKLKSVQSFADSILNSHSPEEVLSSESNLVERLNELSIHEEYNIKVNSLFDLVSFDVTKALACIDSAWVYECGIIPSMIEFNVNSIPIEGEVVLYEVVTLEADGHPTCGEGDNVQATITSPSGQETIPDLNLTDCGEYSFSFMPKEPGHHTVCVNIRGQQAWKKPKQFYVSRNFMNIHHVRSGFGTRGGGQGEFSGPGGVAASATGITAVADTGNHRIQLFDANGNFLKMFGREGKKLGEMRYPRSVAFSSDGSIVVLDSGNSRVLLFNQNGQFLRSFAKEGSGNGEFSCPMGLSIDNKDRIIISDTGNNRVQVFNLKGNFELEFGVEGPGKVRLPESAIFANDCFIVADTGNNCLKFFSPEGQHFETLNSINKEVFSSPCHVSSDPNGFLVVCNRESHRLKILNPDKALVMILSTWGSRLGQLLYPQCTFIYPNGTIAVADAGNHRIQNFY